MVELFYIIVFFIIPMIWSIWFAISNIKDFNESCDREREQAQKRHAIPFDESQGEGGQLTNVQSARARPSIRTTLVILQLT